MVDRPILEGKLPRALLAELLESIGPDPDVLLGPAIGEDACALAIAGEAIVVATDPITLTGSRAGTYAVQVNANDVAVMGVRPRWFLAVVLMPPGSAADDVRVLFDEMRTALAAVGARLVGGHTEVTAAVHRPVIVGQMIGVAADRRFVRTGGVRPGDHIVQVGPVPVEGAAVLASAGPTGLSDEAMRTALGALDEPGILVVESALEAARLGATSLHDPTEGGLAAGLNEMAIASGVQLTIERSAVMWFEPGLAVCRAMGADPWATLASGCLLAAFAGREAGEAVRALTAGGYPAVIIGEAVAGAGVVDTDGAPIPFPERDEVARLGSG